MRANWLLKITVLLLTTMQACSVFSQEATLRVLIAGDEGGWSPHWNPEEIYASGDVLTGLSAGQLIGIDLVRIPERWLPSRTVVQLIEGENLVQLSYYSGPELDFVVGEGELFFKEDQLRHEVRGGNERGDVIVGNYLKDGIWHPSVWRPASGFEAVSKLPGTDGMHSLGFQTIQGASANGSVLVGRAVDNMSRTVPVVWQLQGDGQYMPIVLPVPDLGWGSLAGRAIDVNEGGTVVVGTRLSQGAVWRLQPTTGQWVLHAETGLGRWQSDETSANYQVWLYGVSGDGQTSVGWIELHGSGSGYDELAVVFEDGALQELPTPGGFAYSLAYGISADGNRIVGVLGDDERDHLAVWSRPHRGSSWTLANAPVPEPFEEINIPCFANRDGHMVFAPLVGDNGRLYVGYVWTPETGFIPADEWFANDLGVTVTEGFSFIPRYFNPHNGVAYGTILGAGRVGFRLQLPTNLEFANLQVNAAGTIPEGHPAQWRVAGGKWYAIGTMGKVLAGEQLLEIRGAPGYRAVPDQLIHLQAQQNYVLEVALLKQDVRRGDLLATLGSDLPNRPGRFYRAIPDGHGGIWATDGIGSTAGLGTTLMGALYRLDAQTGQPMQGYNPTLLEPSVWLMDVFPDGSALVASRNGTDEFLRKILPDGSEDHTFHPFRVNRTRMAKILANGDIVVAVAETELGGPMKGARVYRLRPDGRVDPRWQTVRLEADDAGPWETNVWARFIEDAQGRIVIAGAFGGVNGVATAYMARLMPNGRLDESFQTPLKTLSGRAIRGLGLQSDGKIIVAGVFSQPDNDFALGSAVMRLNENGSLDPSFQAPGYRDLQGNLLIYDLIVLPDDRLLLGGSMGAIRLLPDGAVDSEFSQVISTPEPQGYWPPDFPDYLFWVESLADGYLLAGSIEEGGITQGVRQFGLFKVDEQGGLMTGFAAPQPFALAFPNRALRTADGSMLTWGMAQLNFQRAFAARAGEAETFNAIRLEVSGAEILLSPQASADFRSMGVSLRDALQLPSGRIFGVVQGDSSGLQLVEIGVAGINFITDVFTISGNYRGMRAAGENAIALIFAGNTSDENVTEHKIREFRILSYSTSGELVGDLSRWQDLQEFTHPDFGYKSYAFGSVDNINLWHVDAFMRMLVTSPDSQGNPVLRRIFMSGAVDNSFAPITFTSNKQIEPLNRFMGAIGTSAVVYSSAASVYSVQVLPDGSLLVGGEFDEAHGSGQWISGSPLIKIRPSGSGYSTLSAPVQLSGSDPVVVHDILLAEPYVYVVGTFGEVDSADYRGLVRLFASDLGIDYRFRPGVEFVSYDYSNATAGGVAVLPNGNLLVMGQFRRVGEIWPSPFHVLDTSPLGPWQVQANVSDPQMGSVQGAGQYADGTILSLTAIPSSGYQFKGWAELEMSPVHPLIVRVEEDLFFTAVFEAIPLLVAEIPNSFAFVPGPDATLSVDASGYNLTFEWLIGDDPDLAAVFLSTDGRLPLAELSLIGGQSQIIRLRVTDGFGNSMVSAPTEVQAESPLKGQRGWQQSDILVGDLAIHSDELAYSSTFGWFFHDTFPWIYLPEWGWAQAQTDRETFSGQLLWMEAHEWVWVPSDSTGQFYIIADNQWAVFY